MRPICNSHSGDVRENTNKIYALTDKLAYNSGGFVKNIRDETLLISANISRFCGPLAATAFVVAALAAAPAFGEEKKALVSSDDRKRVLKMLSPQLPDATGEDVADSTVTHKGVLLKNLPEKFNTEAIKDALVDRKEIPLYAHNPTQGPPSAPVTIVEFSDISCETCPDVYPNVEKVTDKYPDHIRWVHKHASLNPFGTNSLAAFYSKVANEYGLFWPYRTEVRKLQKQTDESLVGAMVNAGVPVRNSQQLVRLHARDVYRGLDADLALNMRIGLKSPPAVLVNGVVIGGAIPLDMLEDLVAYELTRQGISPDEESNKDAEAKN